jgi:hypothetical protein
MVALLLSFTLPKGLRLVSIITLAVIAVVIALGAVLLRRFCDSSAAAPAFCIVADSEIEKWIRKGSSLEDRVYGFYHEMQDFCQSSFWSFVFTLPAVTEIYVTLVFISPIAAKLFSRVSSSNR